MAGQNFWDFQQHLKGPSPSPAPQKTAAKPEKPLTVSQLTSRIDKALKAGLPASLRVRGEVSNFKLHNTSGHAYFTLKDAAACIDCVMFRSEAELLKFTPTDGLEVVATGRIDVFAPKGRYQLYATHLEPLGQGALELARQQIQKRLQAEGLFDPARKKPLPRYPRHILIISSTQTAALQDILKVLARFAFLQIQIYHVPVQGDGSAERIAAALGHAAAIASIDLILLARGGGSLEDLWEFNEEIVARAIAASRAPVMTGIGHEIDVSIADLVADYHAHTPTEAAQVAVRHWRNAAELIDAAALRLRRQVKSLLDQSRQRLAHVERHEFFRRPLDRINQLRQLLDERERSLFVAVTARLRLAHDRTNRLDARLRERHPRHLIALQSQRTSALSQRLTRATAEVLQNTTRRLDLLAARLHCVNPQEVLKRGYSLTTHKKSGQIIKDPAQVKPGDTLVTRLASGQIESKVEDTRQLKLFD